MTVAEKQDWENTRIFPNFNDISAQQPQEWNRFLDFLGILQGAQRAADATLSDAVRIVASRVACPLDIGDEFWPVTEDGL